MSRQFLLPYRKGSKSVKALWEGCETNFKLIRLKDSKYKSKHGDKVLNWGNSTSDLDLSKATVLNHPDQVREVSNKKRFFEMMSELPDAPNMPDWTTSKQEAQQWSDEGAMVFARTKLTGHSGQGIVVVEPNTTNIPSAPLYTKYVKKKDEFRCHFWKGEVFDVQRKARRRDHEDPNFLIRSHENGFVYARENIEVPDAVHREADKVVTSGVLDFGAIDIIYNRLHDKAYVLEVNTSPGLEGTTLYNYAQKVDEWFKE